MAETFTFDVAGIGKVLAGAQAVHELQTRAARVVAEAQRNGPRGKHPGAHQVDKLAVGSARITSQGAVVDILWASPFWHLVEFGSANNQPYRPVTRGAEAAGLKVIDARGAQ